MGRAICPTGYVMDTENNVCVPGHSPTGDGRPGRASNVEFGGGGGSGFQENLFRRGPGSYKRRGGPVRRKHARGGYSGADVRTPRQCGPMWPPCLPGTSCVNGMCVGGHSGAYKSGYTGYRRGRQVIPRGGRRAQAQHLKKKPPISGCLSLGTDCGQAFNSCCPGLSCEITQWEGGNYGAPGQYWYSCQESTQYDCLPPGANCTHSPACCSGQCYGGGSGYWPNPPGGGGTCL